ncbi:MAG: response regulator [Candidatus Omnitrophica bacterium]|nr:response regulator [Candidatus Omnitrophota bacterium]
MQKKILVVDDDRLNTTLIRFSLRDENYAVVTAHDGLEGIAAVKEEAPDLIVLDIQMPEMSGFEFMNELKMLPGASRIPVVMLTANAEMKDIFFSEGVKGYFVKPVDMPKLLAKIRECLGSSGTQNT